MMVLLLLDVLTVRMSMNQSHVHYPHSNAPGVNILTTMVGLVPFGVRDAFQEITVRQAKNFKFTPLVVKLSLKVIYLVHRDYQVVQLRQLHARAPALHHVPMVLENRHLMMDVIPVQQEHTRMERC